MTSFKQFLLEAADGDKPSYSSMDVETAINFLNAKCRDSLWMLKSNRPIYRGDPSIPKSNFLTVDSTTTTRKSQNTSNYYTVILDNTPSMKGFPKRSKSFVGATHLDNADEYAGRGSVWIVIPTDSCKIGVVNSYDMWTCTVKFPTFSAEIDNANEFFETLGLPADYEAMKAFGEKLKNSDKYNAVLNSAIASINFDVSINDGDVKTKDSVALKNDFLGTLDKAYSPANTKLKHYTPATLPKNLQNNEVWIEGEVVFISLKMWKKLLAAYGK